MTDAAPLTPHSRTARKRRSVWPMVRPSFPMTKTTDQLLEDLATKGGAIVATGECSPLEIAVARRCGDMAVRDDGIGFIRRSPGWVKMADEGLAVRAYDRAMRPRGSRSNNPDHPRRDT